MSDSGVLPASVLPAVLSTVVGAARPAPPRAGVPRRTRAVRRAVGRRGRRLDPVVFVVALLAGIATGVLISPPG